MKRSLSPLQSYYAARAGEYDAIYRKPERQADLRAIEQWLPSVLRDRRVLEIACGTGYWTQFLAPAACSVAAIDSAEETLRIARDRVRQDNVSFAVGDAYAPRQHGRSFDAAFAGFWFSHVPLERRVEFLDALNAALEPGATVVLLDNRFVEGSSTPISRRDADGNTYQVRKLANGEDYEVVKNFPTEEELREAVGDVAAEAHLETLRYYWLLVFRTK